MIGVTGMVLLVSVTTQPLYRRERETLEKNEALWKIKQNLWSYLAQLTNMSHFCMVKTATATNVLETCMVVIPTLLRLWTKLIWGFIQDEEVEEGDVLQNYTYNPYYACINCTGEDFITEDMITIKTQHIASAERCYQMTCDQNKIGKCQHMKIERKTGNNEINIICSSRTGKDCKKIRSGKNMKCNNTVTSPSYIQHVKLPKGWMFSCGNITFNYIPANKTGGPCVISRLGLMMYPLFPSHKIKRSKRGFSHLSENCNYNVNLLTESEILGIYLTMVGSPVITAYAAHSVGRLSCLVARSINITSRALENILLDIQSYRKAILQNRATIDYLLIHNHGCQEFDEMCFNLSDHSQDLQSQIDQLQDDVNHITRSDGKWWDWLFSWLPDFGYLRYILGVIFAKFVHALLYVAVYNVFLLCYLYVAHLLKLFLWDMALDINNIWFQITKGGL
ncbi:uncharacterized protein [Phyllobates terribilis]|uniref:uncharacterized protein n=1 Tax=Phyllobates terribilis TaxID=111132 RepID=UPI003CCB6396